MQPLAHTSWNNSTNRCKPYSELDCGGVCILVRDICLPVLVGLKAAILFNKSFVFAFPHEMAHFGAVRLLTSEMVSTMRFYSWEGALGIKRFSPLKCLSIEFHALTLESVDAHIEYSPIKWNRVGKALGWNFSRSLICIAAPITDAVILNSFFNNRICHLWDTILKKKVTSESIEFRWALCSLAFSYYLLLYHFSACGIINFSGKSVLAGLQNNHDIEIAAHYLRRELKIPTTLCAAIMRIAFTALPVVALYTATIRCLSSKG